MLKAHETKYLVNVGTGKRTRVLGTGGSGTEQPSSYYDVVVTRLRKKVKIQNRRKASVNFLLPPDKTNTDGYGNVYSWKANV
jgi:hypothetical protein